MDKQTETAEIPERIRLFLHDGKLSDTWYNAVVAPGPHEIIYVREDTRTPHPMDIAREVEAKFIEEVAARLLPEEADTFRGLVKSAGEEWMREVIARIESEGDDG